MNAFVVRRLLLAAPNLVPQISLLDKKTHALQYLQNTLEMALHYLHDCPLNKV
jgi:hypothetical protein